MRTTQIETVYTEKEWMNHVEKHWKEILKRWGKRKLKRMLAFLGIVMPFYLAYSVVWYIAMM